MHRSLSITASTTLHYVYRCSHCGTINRFSSEKHADSRRESVSKETINNEQSETYKVLGEEAKQNLTEIVGDVFFHVSDATPLDYNQLSLHNQCKKCSKEEAWSRFWPGLRDLWTNHRGVFLLICIAYSLLFISGFVELFTNTPSGIIMLVIVSLISLYFCIVALHNKKIRIECESIPLLSRPKVFLNKNNAKKHAHAMEAIDANKGTIDSKMLLTDETMEDKTTGLIATIREDDYVTCPHCKVKSLFSKAKIVTNTVNMIPRQIYVCPECGEKAILVEKNELVDKSKEKRIFINVVCPKCVEMSSFYIDQFNAMVESTMFTCPHCKKKSFFGVKEINNTTKIQKDYFLNNTTSNDTFERSLLNNNNIANESLGNDKEDSPFEIVFCHKCGQRLLPDSSFCSRCGTKIR